MTGLLTLGCTALLVYWTLRVCLLMRGDARTNEILESDLRNARAVWLALRGLFLPSLAT